MHEPHNTNKLCAIVDILKVHGMVAFFQMLSETTDES